MERGRLLKSFLTVLAFAALTGCANKPAVLATTFDLQAAEKQLQDGPNTVTGSALIRQSGGGVVTCAGGSVFLMPKTARAREWAFLVYGTSGPAGYRSASGRGISFDSTDRFFSTVRTATCDAQGNFKFARVGNGEFLLFTRITWMVGSSLQGGSIMRSVSLQNGESLDVVLSPG